VLELGPVSDVASLERELRETRERFQATIEDYETALEELKSGNEKLHAVNNELAAKVEESNRANADLRNLLDSAQIATVFLDRDLVLRSYTPAVTSIFKLDPGDRGRPVTDIAHQLADVDLAGDVRSVLNEHKVVERTVRLRNSKVVHLMRILPYHVADEQIDGALITFFNVSEMVAAEEHQRTLVGELNHRVRNMLQVVIGLANQTLHRCESLKQFEAAFIGRMQALARAYDLVSREGWHKVQIAQLLRVQLGAFASEGGRYTAQGESILLTANAALALGLVLYELATNATKYGALSVATGHIDVSWQLRDREDKQVLHFRWRERGGPKVTPPAHHGFGSELVQRQLRYELNGRAAMEFTEEGLEVTVEIPAAGAVVAAVPA
jgi:two-component system, chemotaxis family, CheB/CheR fusion protein